VAEEVRRQFPEAVFETVIPRNIRLSEAPSFASPVAYYDANCSGAAAYSAFAKEVAERWLGRAR
jgi:chromosome partitioning protein